VDDFKFINEWVLACCILHNTCLRFGDEWEDDLEDEVEAELPDFVVPPPTRTTAAASLRARVQNHLLDWFNSIAGGDDMDVDGDA